MQIEWVVVSNDLFKKCLFDSTDTKRNSKEWSRKVVDCLKKKKNHFSNSMMKRPLIYVHCILRQL